MDKEKLVVREIEMPNILVGINEDRYELFCEFQDKNGAFQSVYTQEDGKNVIIEIGKNSAIVGLFSVEDWKVRELFDYIEASLKDKYGFVCTSEDMRGHLNTALEAGGRYPFVEAWFDVSGRVSERYRQKPLSEDLVAQVEGHKVDCEHVAEGYEPDMEDLGIYPEPDEEYLMAPKITQAATLPEGWTWVDYHDGSGHMESPEGERCFHYDLRGDVWYGGGVEYCQEPNGPWKTFPGSFDEFQKIAEETILDNLLEIVGGQKDMSKMDFYVIGDMKENFERQYFGDINSALDRFQEVVRDAHKMPALGVQVADGAIDLLHGLNGESILVPDYKNDKLNFSEQMRNVLPDIAKVVEWLVVEKGCGLYEYQNGLIPASLNGDAKVLVPTMLEAIAGDSYLEGKVLKATDARGIDAIDSLYIEMHGWVGYGELLRNPQEYCAGGIIRVPELNVVYVKESNVVGIDGRMDIAPCEFATMLDKINKPYAIVVYDTNNYSQQYKDKHEFIVASYADLPSAVKGWYELHERKPDVPMLVQKNKFGDKRAVFNGRDKDDKEMSIQDAAKVFGFDCLGSVLDNAAERSGGSSAGKDMDCEQSFE